MAKGSQFERDICKLLSLWWSKQKRDDIFWRTSQSGGRSTERRKKGLKTASGACDLAATHATGKSFTRVAVVEMKRGYSDKHKIVKGKIKKTSYGLSFLSIIDKQARHQQPTFTEWWQKLEMERISNKRNCSILIFKRDSKRRCIAIDQNAFDFISKRSLMLLNCNRMTINFDHAKKLPSVVIMRIEDFLKYCQPKTFREIPRPIPRRRKLFKHKRK